MKYFNSSLRVVKRPLIAALDPGTTAGALVVIDSSSLRKCASIKLEGTHWAAHSAAYGNILRAHSDLNIILLERVGMRPGQGRASNAKLLSSFMFSAGYFTGRDLTTIIVEPLEWQNPHGLGGKHGPEGCSASTEYKYKKRAHHTKANEIHKEPLELWEADAYLMAVYWSIVGCDI